MFFLFVLTEEGETMAYEIVDMHGLIPKYVSGATSNGTFVRTKVTTLHRQAKEYSKL